MKKRAKKDLIKLESAIFKIEDSLVFEQSRLNEQIIRLKELLISLETKDKKIFRAEDNKDQLKDYIDYTYHF